MSLKIVFKMVTLVSVNENCVLKGDICVCQCWCLCVQNDVFVFQIMCVHNDVWPSQMICVCTVGFVCAQWCLCLTDGVWVCVKRTLGVHIDVCVCQMMGAQWCLWVFVSHLCMISALFSGLILRKTVFTYVTCHIRTELRSICAALWNPVSTSCFCLFCGTAGKTTTDEELEDMLESGKGNPAIFTQGVSNAASEFNNYPLLGTWINTVLG